jgi:NAD(P)-dependent dehydrogenase (short-subunit alcohol dehydrogenase family)
MKEDMLTPSSPVYALDRLETPSPDFARVQKRASSELGTSLSYRRIDVRDVDSLNAIVADIATQHGRLDGLIAAAGIQQETPALEYSAQDCNLMLGVNVTGCFMTAQAVARQMIRFGNGGSIVMIASMSGTIANRVRSSPCFSSQYLPLSLPSSLQETKLTERDRDSSARPTTPPKPPSSNSGATWPPNGASMGSASTPFPRATS